MSLDSSLRFAILDLGSRSVRLDVYEVGLNYQLDKIHSEKFALALGEDVFEQQSVGKETLGLLCSFFEKTSILLKKMGVHRVTAYATSAMRDAENSEAVLLAIKKSSGIEVEIISGEREARLIARGVLSNSVTPVSHFALVDIGGGSTEISVVENNRVSSSHSFNLGTVRLQKQILLDYPPKASLRALHPIKTLKRQVWEAVAQARDEHRWPKLEWVVGSSGNVRTLRRVMKLSGFRVDPFRKRDLARLNKTMASLEWNALLNLPGLDAKRAEVVLAGGLILEEIMEVLGAKRMHTTGFALNDGILEMELDKLQTE